MSQIAAEPYIGKVLSERSFTLENKVVDDYFKGLNLKPNGLLPSMVASEPDNNYFNEIAFPNHIGHLWMRQEWELRQPLVAESNYSVSGVIKDIYQKRNRNVVQYEVVLKDESGSISCASQHHQSFLAEVPEAAEVEFRDPTKKPGARKFVIPEGSPFGGLERKITVQMCGDFFHGDANYHTDKESSKELGFQDVVVGGRMTMAYAAAILEEQFGDAWWTSGKLDVKFTNPTWADDTVTAHGVVTGESKLDPGRIGAFVWLSKPDDSIVLIANASIEV